MIDGADGSRRRSSTPDLLVGAPLVARRNASCVPAPYRETRRGPDHDRVRARRRHEDGHPVQTACSTSTGVPRHALRLPHPDDEPNAARAKRHDDVFELGDDGFLTDKPLVPSHLWLVPSTGGRALSGLRTAGGAYTAGGAVHGRRERTDRGRLVAARSCLRARRTRTKRRLCYCSSVAVSTSPHGRSARSRHTAPVRLRAGIRTGWPSAEIPTAAK